MNDAANPNRSRTVTWEDPLPVARAAHAMSGLEFIRALAEGALAMPPVARLLDFRPTEVEEGRVVFEMRVGEHQYNPIGSVHGGVVATLLDSAMGCAVNTTLQQGVGYTTAELKVNFIRPVTFNAGVVRCEGKIIHSGARTATAEGRVTDAAGKLYAHATTTCLIFPIPVGA